MPHKVLEPLPGQPFKTLAVSLPVDMHPELVSLAKEAGRSLHSELLVVLEQALQPLGEALEDSDIPRW